mgnify:CR=1 FL=1
MSIKDSQGAMDELIEGEVEKQIQMLLEQRKQSLADEFASQDDINQFDDSDTLAAEFAAMEPAPEPEEIISLPPVVPTCSVGCQVDMENLHSSLYSLGDSSDEESEEKLLPVSRSTSLKEPELQILPPVQETVVIDEPEESISNETEEAKQIEAEELPETVQEPMEEPELPQVQHQIEEPQEEEKQEEPIAVEQIPDDRPSREEFEAQENRIKELESTIQDLQRKAKQHTKETRVLRGTIKQLGTVHDQYRSQIKSLEEKNTHVHNKYRTIVEEFERKLEHYKEKEISVLEQLFRLRERFSYAQKVVKSPTMKQVLKVGKLSRLGFICF